MTTLYAPSTLGSFLREFTLGRVRQPGAVASRFLSGLAEIAPIVAGGGGRVMIDIDVSSSFSYVGTLGVSE